MQIQIQTSEELNNLEIEIRPHPKPVLQMNFEQHGVSTAWVHLHMDSCFINTIQNSMRVSYSL